MKLYANSLLLAAVAHGAVAYTYNGFVNRELERYEGALFGQRLADKKKKQNVDAWLPGHLRQRRTEGEVPDVPELDVDDDEYFEREQQSHYQVSHPFYTKWIGPTDSTFCLNAFF
jgi:hypothetical protein